MNRENPLLARCEREATLARYRRRAAARLDSGVRWLLVAVVLVALLAGCAPSCVVYQHQHQGCPAPAEVAP